MRLADLEMHDLKSRLRVLVKFTFTFKMGMNNTQSKHKLCSAALLTVNFTASTPKVV